MSLWSYELFFWGALLGGVLLLVLFSLLAMAQKGDADQDQLEYELSQAQIFPPYQGNVSTADEACASADSKSGQGSVPKKGMLFGR